MSDRHAVEIKWDGRKKRYVARLKKYPALTAYGSTLPEAQASMRAALAEHLSGETLSHSER